MGWTTAPVSTSVVGVVARDHLALVEWEGMVGMLLSSVFLMVTYAILLLKKTDGSSLNMVLPLGERVPVVILPNQKVIGFCLNIRKASKGLFNIW